MRVFLLTSFVISFNLFSQHDSERPNILFAIADDWSYGHAGAYGCKWVSTPAFDRITKVYSLTCIHSNVQNVHLRVIILTEEIHGNWKKLQITKTISLQV